MLAAAGLAFDLVPSESTSASGWVNRRGLRPPAGQEKSARAFTPVHSPVSRSRTVVLGADTAVVIDGAILGKPRDDEEAREMLQWLSGRRTRPDRRERAREGGRRGRGGADGRLRRTAWGRDRVARPERRRTRQGRRRMRFKDWRPVRRANRGLLFKRRRPAGRGVLRILGRLGLDGHDLAPGD